jgi:NAD(P)-dependent dehydrogenase (short-subunit alcohol dehydrogenase family)
MVKKKTSMNGFPDASVNLPNRSVQALNFTGLRVAVVGGTDGLGRAIARRAATQGAEVLVVGRTFRDEGTPRLSFRKADLSLMSEARRIGRELKAELDAVVLTTGIMAAKQREVTTDGLERDMAVSALSRYAIVEGLVPRLAASQRERRHRPRVFVMGFPGAGGLGNPDDLNAEGPYDAMTVHLNTVAANEALVLWSKDRYPEVAFYGLNPGGVRTNIRANYLGAGSAKHRIAEFLIGLLMPSAESYAEKVLPLLVAPELEGRSGLMFGKTGRAILPSDGFDAARAARFADAAHRLLSRTSTHALRETVRA